MAAGTTPALFESLPEPSRPAGKPARRADEQFPHLWLCIHLPRLALESGSPSGATAGPLVVVDGEGSHCAVHVADEMARRYGLRRGLGLNAAYALCPQLQVRPREPDRERRRLEKLALWATQFTPWVHVEESAALLLEVRGSLKLFAGAEKLCARIGSELDAMHHHGELALAPTPLAALWLARAGQSRPVTQPRELAGRLGKLPLHCLGWADKTVASLQGMGVYCLGDCLRLPRDGFARRFGRRYLRQLDRALGRLPDPRPSFIAPQRFRKTIGMPAETTDTGKLSLAAERLLAALSRYLIARQAGIQNIRLRFFHAGSGGTNCPPTRIRLGLLEHCQDSGRLLSLLRLKLESLQLPAPVIAVELSSGEVTTLACRERNLFAYRPGGSADWPGLLENLRTKLGVSAVYSVAAVADHRPESAWCRVEPSGEGGHASAVRSGEVCLADRSRPLWLLSQPRRLNTVAGRPGYDGPLVCESGPERIETGWWDGNDTARDYYVMRDLRGLRLWVYRERRAPRGWYLHGYFG